MGPSWGCLGTLLGPSWQLLGALGALLGRSWALLGRSGRDKKRKKNAFFPLLLLLGRSWLFFGASWPHLGPSRAHLEGSWEVFWSLHGLPPEIPTHVPGKVVTPGCQEHVWEFLRWPSAKICWELLGVRCSSSWHQSLGTSLGCGGLREAVYNYIVITIVIMITKMGVEN